MPRKQPYSLSCSTTADLLDELKRRALGCMIVCVRAEETGDVWHYAVKGSPLLLGAMSAALSLHTSRKLAERGGEEPQAVAR